MSITITVDGKEEEVSFAGGFILYGGKTVGTYGFDPAREPKWQFGDILHWRKDGPASEDLMFICYDADPKPPHVWFMALVDGLVDVKRRSVFERVDE